MNRAFVIAVEGREVGLAVVERGGFHFVAAHADWRVLDGSRFRRLEQVERAASTLARVVSGVGSPKSAARPARGH